MFEFNINITSSGESVNIKASLSVGSRLHLVGGAGAGKSQFARRLAGLTDVKEGSVTYSGKPLADVSPMEWSECIGMIPSDPELSFSFMTDSLQEELELSFQMLGRPVDQKTIDNICDELDLIQFLMRDPFSLSGGEKARVAYAITLVKKPRILIVDDALTELSPMSAELVRDYLEKLRHSQGLIVIETMSVIPEIHLSTNAQWILLDGQGACHGDLKSMWQASANLNYKVFPNCVKTPYFFVTKNASKESSSSLHRSISGLKEQMTERGFNAQQVSHGASSSEFLRLNGVEHSYAEGSNFLLGPISHSFEPGTVNAIIGPNGAGKTTLLRSIGRILPSEGEVWVKDLQLNGRPVEDCAKSVLYCFQNPDDQLYLETVEHELLGFLDVRCGILMEPIAP